MVEIGRRVQVLEAVWFESRCVFVRGSLSLRVKIAGLQRLSCKSTRRKREIVFSFSVAEPLRRSMNQKVVVGGGQERSMEVVEVWKIVKKFLLLMGQEEQQVES